MKKITLTMGLFLITLMSFAQVTNKNNQMAKNNFSSQDMEFFKTCVGLAEESVANGSQPFGSILVNDDDEILAEARNRVNEEGVLAHPEIALAEWAVQNLTLQERRNTTMYTTGEHCPMCAGAHAWAQIKNLYFLTSAEQLGEWLNEFGVAPSPIKFVDAATIVKDVNVKGPAEGELVEKIKKMHHRYYSAIK